MMAEVEPDPTLLSALEVQPSLEQETDERFSQAAVEAIKNNSSTYADEHDHPTHHYNQAMDDWGGKEAVGELIARHGIEVDGLTITVFGGFTGELARYLRDLGSDVVFTDPLSVWTDRAKEDGFDVHTCPAELIPGEVIAQSDALATFECYYPLQCPPEYSLYNALRFLSVPQGILFAETDDTRAARQGSGAEYASLDIFRILSDFIEVEWNYRETGNLRLYHYSQPEEMNFQSHLCAKVMDCLYHRGTPDEVTTVDEQMIKEITEEMRSDQVTVEGHAQKVLLMYRDSIGGMAKFLPKNQIQIGGRKFALEFEL